MLHKILVPALIALVSSSAFAQDSGSSSSDSGRSSSISRGGLFVEPMILTSRENASIQSSQLPGGFLSNTSGTMSGIGLGAKFGIHVSETFFLGADARYSRAQMNDSSYEKAEGDMVNYGPTAGLQMPVAGLRLLGTYVMGGEYNPGSGASGFDLKFKDPRGFRVGAGFHLAAVSVNLEYADLTYDKTQIESTGTIVPGGNTNVDFKNQGYTLSLSFPVEL